MSTIDSPSTASTSCYRIASVYSSPSVPAQNDIVVSTHFFGSTGKSWSYRLITSRPSTISL